MTDTCGRVHHARVFSRTPYLLTPSHPPKLRGRDSPPRHSFILFAQLGVLKSLCIQLFAQRQDMSTKRRNRVDTQQKRHSPGNHTGKQFWHRRLRWKCVLRFLAEAHDRLCVTMRLYTSPVRSSRSWSHRRGCEAVVVHRVGVQASVREEWRRLQLGAELSRVNPAAGREAMIDVDAGRGCRRLALAATRGRPLLARAARRGLAPRRRLAAGPARAGLLLEAASHRRA